MKEEVIIIWKRPYQTAEDGTILTEAIRASNRMSLDEFGKASRLMELLDTKMQEFSQGKED